MVGVVRPTVDEKLEVIMSKGRRIAADSRPADHSGNAPYTSEEIWGRDMSDKEFLFYVNRPMAERVKSMRDGGMKGQYLGACLDYVRYGAMNACFWELGGVKGLVGFVQEWMDMNKDNLIWSDQQLPAEFALPYINYGSCPRDKNCGGTLHHIDTVKDGAGRMRCAHVSREKNEPHHCYQIISEPVGMVLPLEKIFGRLNIADTEVRKECPDVMNCEVDQTARICFGHWVPNLVVGFPFCGWTAAWYVQKWHEQVPNGGAPLYMPEGEADTYRAFPKFQVISSDD